jgi:hypothetical protein
MADGSPDMPHNLKIRQTEERANDIRFTIMLDGFEDSTPLDVIEHYCGHSKETLERLIFLDDSIRVLLPDKQYEEDIKTCEDYTDKTKRAIKKASRGIENSLFPLHD